MTRLFKCGQAFQKPEGIDLHGHRKILHDQDSSPSLGSFRSTDRTLSQGRNWMWPATGSRINIPLSKLRRSTPGFAFCPEASASKYTPSIDCRDVIAEATPRKNAQTSRTGPYSTPRNRNFESFGDLSWPKMYSIVGGQTS